ncbi:divergent PAP2 family protein [Candidatus Woesearchaeota archaeon]|nr:divergent PAP2 family protein [Candidatus Woesearchaeota archaeon]
MNFAEILLNPIFFSCLVAVVIAQLIKIVIDYLKDRKLNTSLFFSTGGMPSGHTAVVTALATSVYIKQGVTALFAVVLVIAIMTIYDSLTIRKAVGHHTSILNAILKALKLHKKMAVKELAGHSLTQVIVGMLLGFIVAYLVSMI